MKEKRNTGYGLIKAVSERAQNENSLFESALKKLVNSTEEDLKAFLEMKTTNKYLKRIYANEVFEIDACDGTRTIAEATEVFKKGITLNGISLGTSCKKTEPTKIDWHLLIKDANHKKMFGVSCDDINKLGEIMFTQNQVVNISKKFLLNHKTFLIGDSILIPFEDKGKYVARVRLILDGLSVTIYNFWRNYYWSSTNNNFVATPEKVIL